MNFEAELRHLASLVHEAVTAYRSEPWEHRPYYSFSGKSAMTTRLQQLYEELHPNLVRRAAEEFVVAAMLKAEELGVTLPTHWLGDGVTVTLTDDKKGVRVETLQRVQETVVEAEVEVEGSDADAQRTGTAAK